MAEPNNLELSRRWTKRILILPLYLVMCMVPGYIFGLTQMGSTQPFSISDDIGKAVVWLAIDLPLTYIPFVFLNVVGRSAIRANRKTVYPIAGALIGLSVITGLLWVLVGLLAATAGGATSDFGGLSQANAMFVVVIAPIAGIAGVFVGGVLGIIYQFFRSDPPSENGTKTPNTDTNG